MSATVNKCQVSYLEMLGTYPVYQVYMKPSGSEMSYTWPVFCSRYGWNNKGSLVASRPVHIAGSKHFLKASNTMQQTHTVFGELAHYGSEPFIYSLDSGVIFDHAEAACLY